MKTLAWIIIIILVGYGIYWFSNRDDGGLPSNTYNSTNNSSTDNSQSTTTVNINTSTSTSPTGPKTVTVIYGMNGFSPSTMTIKKGDNVTFVNQSSSGMWVASAMHPTHAVYDGTNLNTHCAAGATPSFDQCKNTPNGGTYSFTFNKLGSWSYHNHSAASDFGKIVVE